MNPLRVHHESCSIVNVVVASSPLKVSLYAALISRAHLTKIICRFDVAHWHALLQVYTSPRRVWVNIMCLFFDASGPVLSIYLWPFHELGYFTC
jgi:hypothetical protein